MDHKDVIKKISRFDDKNIMNFNFFVLLNTDENTKKIINNLRQDFNDLIKIKQTDFFSSHVTMLFGIKFDNISNLANFLIHLKKLSKEYNQFSFEDVNVKMFKDPKTIVITPDTKSTNIIKKIRKEMLTRNDLFSDVLSFPYMTYVFNRYHKYDKENTAFKPHIGLLYFYHYKGIYEALSNSDKDYVFDFAIDYVNKNIKTLSIESISVVCSTVDDDKWQNVIDFKLN